MIEDRILVAKDEAPATARRVLVVDDSQAQRRMLGIKLARWGYEVDEAETGEGALALAEGREFDIVVSDWVMAGMSGLELCRAFRDLPREAYTYFIMLTSKSGRSEMAKGLETGADDFIAKPVHFEELRARLRVGERILEMQEELLQKSRQVEEAYEQLQVLYDSLDRDLIEARKLQKSLVMDRQRRFGRSTATALYRPSGRIGGDLVGAFRINRERVAIYSVDVSGHGVASAMMTARLSGFLSGDLPDQNLALSTSDDGDRRAWPPEEVAARLNRLMLEESTVEQYFTMVYAEIDLPSGTCQLVQAGHPYPVLIRRSGKVEVLGDGGLPIGLIEGAVYERVTVKLTPGDRLLLVSDGMTECPDPAGGELGQQGLVKMVSRNTALDSPKLLQALLWDLSEFAGSGNFRDDVSALVFDYFPPVRSTPVRRRHSRRHRG